MCYLTGLFVRSCHGNAFAETENDRKIEARVLVVIAEILQGILDLMLVLIRRGK